MSKAAEKVPVPSSLEIHLLGPLRMYVDGASVDESRWVRRKPKLLVKLLTLQPHHQLHREQLMEFLWPDLDPEAASNNLNKAIHGARRALEPTLESGSGSHFILTRGQQVLLRAPEKLWIDMEEFEQAAAHSFKSSDMRACEKALGLYEGDLLIEDPYEDWATTRRENLRSIHKSLLIKLSQLHENAGEYLPAIERLKEVVAISPAEEEAHRQLMRLYAITGNRQQAIQQYVQCCKDLHRELAVEPERSTVKLHEEIIAGGLELPVKNTTQSVSLSGQAINSIAILPLANAGADEEVEYLSDGITEGIIKSLSQLPALRTMAWSTVSRYKGKEIDPIQVGRELGVRAVLTGRVLQLSDHLIVRTELVDAADGSRLWGEQYDLQPADISAVEGEISSDISRKLQLKLTGEEKKKLTRRYTDNTAAYHAYLKGRYYWNKRSPLLLKKGVEYFRQAIDLDPSYASAYAGLSDSYTLLVVREAISPEEGFAKAKAAAEMALEIDEMLAEAHASLGHAMLHNWEWDEGEVELKTAIELNAGYPSAHHWYSEHLTAKGRCNESIAELKLAAELDPLSLIINADLGRAFYYARQYDEVIEQEARTLEMDPGFWLSHINLGRSYTQKRMHPEAIAELRKACESSPGNTEVLSFLGFAYAAANQRGEALKMLDELNEQSLRTHVPPYHFAILYAGIGDSDNAFAWLEKAYLKRAVDFFTLKVEPMFDSLRSDARFSDLLRRTGLQCG